MAASTNLDQIHDLGILETIESDPDATQASIAGQLNVAVGTVNWHLKRLAEKGYVKIQHCERRKLKYIITPEGIALRARLTLDYIHSSFELYRLIRERMSVVLEYCARDSYNTVYIDGGGDVRDICRLTCMERNVNVVDNDSPDIPTVRIVGLKLFYLTPADKVSPEKEAEAMSKA